MEPENDTQIQNRPIKPTGFTTKSVEQPILAAETREKISLQGGSSSQGGGLGGFYRANKIYFWAILAGAVVIILLMSLALRKKPPQQSAEAKIDISIDAPTSVASGSDEVYKITVSSQDSQKLSGMELELVYPDGVAYQSSSPGSVNLSGTTFTIPDLVSGQNAVVIVKTRITGNAGDTKDLSAKLHYQFAGLSSQFLKEQHFSVQIVASNVSVDLSGPSNANNGQAVVYTVTYSNNSDGDIQNSRIAIIYPQGFSFSQSEPQPDLGNNTWDVGTLAKGAGGTISVKGTFSSVHPGESVQALAQFLIKASNGTYYTQSSSQPLITMIADQPLLVTQVVNAPSNNVIEPGANLNYTIKYQNNAVVAANGVNIAVSLDSSSLDLSTIQAQGAIVSNNSIIWNASAVAQLAVLAPSETGSLQFSVRVKNPATKDSSTNLTVVSHVKIKSDEYTSFFPGGDITLKIASPSTISTGLSFVSGSLPPKVGTNTTYKVSFTLRNATNDFSSGVVTAFLPLGAGGFDQSSVTPGEQNKVIFDQSAGKLTWNVGQLPAHTGQFSQARTLEFNINLNPAPAQANQSPVLIKNITFSATDSFTQQPVHNTANDITTSSIQGNGYGNGQVQP